MNKERGSYPVIHIGTSFLLVIFIILCLVTFAVLSLSSALRDQNYSEKEAVRTTAYYAASGTAQEKLGEIVESFQDNSLDKVADITVTADDDDQNITEVFYTVPVDTDQTLEVTVQLSDLGNLDSGIYQISGWKKITSSDWNASSTLPVLDSNK
ncbi:MAG: hypothetical protein PHN80_01635 [Hespellia sp.]|nr:hypothetical protein [Hespellia sp.]